MSFYKTEPPDGDPWDAPPPEDEGWYQCQGFCETMLHDDDSSNVRVGNRWMCPDCASRHPAVVGDVMAAIRADEDQDEFNRIRR